MKKKKFEKVLFNSFMILPLLLILFELGYMWFRNINSSIDIDVGSIWQNMASVIGSSNGFIANPIKYLMHNIFGLSPNLSSFVAHYTEYVIIIEFVEIVYHCVIFIPKTINNFIERGMNK